MTITIQHRGDTWAVIGQGACRDGKIYCHLASTTQFRQQRNGPNPIQIGDWIDTSVILAAVQQDEAAQRAPSAA